MSAQPPRIGLLTKVTYGLGSVAYGVAGQALATSVLTFYLNQVIGIAAPLVGLAIMVSLFVDAIVDPLIGQWSDNTRTRWGRRHPFMYAAALPCALAFYFLWHAPNHWAPEVVFGFMLTMLVVVRFCVALYETASSALAPELAPDYHDRTSLLAFRWFFGVAGGGAMVILLNVVFLRKDATHPLGALNRAGYESFGTVTAIIILVAILLSALTTHRLIPHLTLPPTRRLSLAQIMREVVGTLTNPSLIAVMASGLISGVSGGVGAALNSYFYYHIWGLTPQMAGIITLIYLPAALVGAIGGPLISRRFGKKGSMIGLFSLSLLASVIPLILRLMNIMPGDGSALVITVLVADAFVAGTLGIMGFIIVGSMIADVVEDAAVKTGVRSEGLLFAANGLLPKVTTGIGIFIGSLLIAAVHFPPHAAPGTVPLEVMRHLAFLYLPVYLVLTSLAIGVLIFYRIDENAHHRNLATLREAGMAAEIATERHVETPGGHFPGLS